MQRQQFFGGSAAQSPLFPFLDIGLGVAHNSHKSQQFLLAMRDYMLVSDVWIGGSGGRWEVGIVPWSFFSVQF